MKSILSVLFGFFVSTQASAVLQGANGSGGGMGVVCRNSDGSIKSVELLDLWEARVIYGRTPVVTSASVAEQVEAHMQNLKNSLYGGDLCVGTRTKRDSCNGVRGPEALYHILSFEARSFLNPEFGRRVRGAKLKKTDDAFEVVTPEECEIEQLVRYTDTAAGGSVLINQDLVDYLDDVNEAALYIHEGYYKFLRRSSEKSSIRTRRVVGLTFSGYKFTALEPQLPKQYYDCISTTRPVNRIFVYESDGLFPGGKPGVVYQAIAVAGLQMINFQYPRSMVQMTLDEVFNFPAPFYGWHAFDYEVGFDFGLSLRIGGADGAKQARMRLESAPDQPGTEEQVLNCEMKTRYF